MKYLYQQNIQKSMYKVQQILAKRIQPNTQKPQYLVKWHGYSHKASTWEPIEHLQYCLGIVDEFNHRNTSSIKIVQPKNNDHPKSPNRGRNMQEQLNQYDLHTKIVKSSRHDNDKQMDQVKKHDKKSKKEERKKKKNKEKIESKQKNGSNIKQDKQQPYLNNGEDILRKLERQMAEKFKLQKLNPCNSHRKNEAKQQKQDIKLNKPITKTKKKVKKRGKKLLDWIEKPGNAVKIEFEENDQQLMNNFDYIKGQNGNMKLEKDAEQQDPQRNEIKQRNVENMGSNRVDSSGQERAKSMEWERVKRMGSERAVDSVGLKRVDIVGLRRVASSLEFLIKNEGLSGWYSHLVVLQRYPRQLCAFYEKNIKFL